MITRLFSTKRNRTRRDFSPSFKSGFQSQALERRTLTAPAFFRAATPGGPFWSYAGTVVLQDADATVVSDDSEAAATSNSQQSWIFLDFTLGDFGEGCAVTNGLLIGPGTDNPTGFTDSIEILVGHQHLDVATTYGWNVDTSPWGGSWAQTIAQTSTPVAFNLVANPSNPSETFGTSHHVNVIFQASLMSTGVPFFRNANLVLASTFLNVTITPANGLVITDPNASPGAAPLYTDAAFGTNPNMASVFYEISIPLPNVASVPVAIAYQSQLTTGQIGTFGAPGGYSQIGYFDWDLIIQPT